MSFEIPFGFMKSGSSAVWTNKSHGNLTVSSGTYTLSPGGIYHFDNLIVNAGATLSLGAGSGITQISANYIEINGTIDGRLGQHAGATYTATNPLTGQVYSYSSPQQLGGKVGLRIKVTTEPDTNYQNLIEYGNNGTGKIYEGTGNYGNGVCTYAYYRSSSPGYDVAQSSATYGGHTVTAARASIYSGTQAQNYTGTSSWTNAPSGSVEAAGGARGRHGLGLVLNSKRILGTGQILLNGSNGSRGTSPVVGSSTITECLVVTNLNNARYPGGGGAGGNGGFLLLEYEKDFSQTLLNNANVANGLGGAEQTLHHVSGTATLWMSGQAGSNGLIGSKNAIKI